MTSIPIMIYGVMDFEFDKKSPASRPELEAYPEKFFMMNPYLYTLGMLNKAYSLKTFLLYVCYGLAHSFIIFWVVFYVLTVPGQTQKNG